MKNVVTTRDKDEILILWGCGLLILCTFIAVIYHYVILGFFLDLGWPQNSLGEEARYWANDIYRLTWIAEHFDPFHHFREYIPLEPLPYPPASFLFYALLAQFPWHWQLAIIFLPFLAFLCFWNWRMAPHLDNSWRVFLALALTFFSYPVLFELDRGNLDAWSFVLCAAGITALLAHRPKLSAILIGVVSALKVYPSIFGLLFLLRGRYRQFCLFVGITLLISLASILFLKGSMIEVFNILHTELGRTTEYFTSLDACPNLSLVRPFKLFVSLFLPPEAFPAHAHELARWYKMAMVVFALAVCGLLLHFRSQGRPCHQVTALTCVAIFAPMMSFPYKMLLIYIPLGLLWRDREASWRRFSIALILILLTPKMVFGRPSAELMNNVVMAVLFVVSLLAQTNVKNKAGALEESWKYLFLIVAMVFLAGYGTATYKNIYIPDFSTGKHTVQMSREDAPGHFGHGWREFEKDQYNTYRWTNGFEADVFLRFRYDRGYAFSVDYLNHKGNADQILTILLDDVVVARKRLLPDEISTVNFNVAPGTLHRRLASRHRLRFMLTDSVVEHFYLSLRRGISVSAIRMEPLAPNEPQQQTEK